MQQNPDAMRAFFSRVTPVLPELFNMAYAICGNFDLAEYALSYTLIEAWNGESHGGMGFREGLRNTLRRVAAETALGERGSTSEMTWDGLTEETDDPVMRLLAAESVETRRVVALRYGCGLPVKRVAKVMDVSQVQVSRIEKKAIALLRDLMQ
jgi:DNA-directed RNA polymerase specialized sigma24 family protein